ncbi:DUF2079 domain-containing protein [Leptospira perdikensis]|uniref:DUF2079 domain-containing protein n=1 Tax=Leptospira perdikensis TaxID=2484948 RepID=A0A4R9JM20_9LEPT|nr:DUF2079 domain-containing protein [Leptospira perdikensis]TGL44941.1 DUF2079 domain-containing protein [Leptospira perdikensis]
MVYLFFLFSLVSPFLFISPKNFHTPFQKGVSLFLILLVIVSFWKEKKSKKQSFSFDLLSEGQIATLPYLVCISCIIFLLGSTYHAFHLTKEIANTFLFHDADYIGLSDILLSIANGQGFSTAYYSESGQGSYLSHHFAPGMAVLSPFIGLIPNRWGLAIGIFATYQLGTILWILWAYRITIKNPKKFGVKFLVFWILITNQLYLYRIGSSFHFEALVIVFGFFFFYIWEQRKKIPNVQVHFFWIYYTILSLATILYLSIKEDIGIYLLLFFLPTVLITLYKHWKKIWNPEAPNTLNSFSAEEKNYLRSLILILSIVSLWLGFVFFIYPIFGDKSESITWTNVLTQGYHSAFKQVTGFQKSIQIFLELIVSGGLGIFQMLAEIMGIGLIYVTHLLSTRPWHHEVYTYYSYSLAPFILYAGILWILSEKKISISFAFFILACLFWKNSLDQNFPLDINIKSPWENPSVQKDIHSDLKEINSILLSKSKGQVLLEGENHLQSLDIEKNTLGIFVFSQYNLSFWITDRTKTYPLEQVKNSRSICKTANVCYMVLAEGFTDEILWPKSRILEYKKEFENQKGFLIWKGKQTEVWQLPSIQGTQIHQN